MQPHILCFSLFSWSLISISHFQPNFKQLLNKISFPALLLHSLHEYQSKFIQICSIWLIIFNDIYSWLFIPLNLRFGLTNWQNIFLYSNNKNNNNQRREITSGRFPGLLSLIYLFFLLSLITYSFHTRWMLIDFSLSCYHR